MSFSTPYSFQSTPYEKMVGFFVVIALSIFIYLSTLKSELTDPSRSYAFTTIVGQSYGIVLGAPVKLAGVIIGEVTGIELLTSGKVAISIGLPNKYSTLYTTDSHLEIDSQFTFDTVLVGQGMIFKSGKEKSLLADQSRIRTVEPQSFADLTEQFDFQKIAKQVSNALNSFQVIVNSLAKNQSNLDTIMSNAAQSTVSFKEYGKKLSDTIESFDRLINNVDSQFNPLMPLLESRLKESEQLIIATHQLMENLNTLAVNIKPAVDQTPQSIQQLNHSLLELELLMKKIKSSWLLNASSAAKQHRELLLPLTEHENELNVILTTPRQGNASEN